MKFDSRIGLIKPQIDEQFLCLNAWISTVKNFLEVPLSIYRFEKVCFTSTNTKLANF